MRLTRATTKAIEYACKHYHYSKCNPLRSIGYNVYNGKDDWCGVILYGLGANVQIANPYGLSQGQVLELTRVALNGKQECTSQAVAMSLKELKKDYPLVRLVVSYADVDQHHLGTIYQATNWIYEGQKGAEIYYIVNGVKTHRRTFANVYGSSSIDIVREKYPDAEKFVSQGKRKYLMPMDKKMRKQILPLSKPYPKNEDWVKIDRSIFKKQESKDEQQ